MEVLHLERVHYGTETQFKTTFKAFSVNDWFITKTDGRTMSGIAVLPSAKHAAALATFLKEAKFNPSIKIEPDQPAVPCQEVTPLPFKQLVKRVLADMAKWGTNSEPKLDGTVANPSNQLKKDILAFRAHTIAEKEQATLSVKDRARGVLQSGHNMHELIKNFPPWQDSWDEFVHTHRDTQDRSARPPDPLINDGSIQDFEVRRREKQIEKAILESQPQKATPKPPRDLVEEYFGEVDEDLVRVIEDKMPDREALKSVLTELLEEETDEFVQKLLG